MKNKFRNADTAKAVEQHSVKRQIKNVRNTASTVMGCIVAVATAWQGVNWVNFDITSGASWNAAAPALILSAIIAIGGFLTSINPIKQKV